MELEEILLTGRGMEPEELSLTDNRSERYGA